MKHVYGEHCLGCTAVNNWRKGFRQGRETVKDGLRPGQVHVDIPDASVAAIDEMVGNDRRVATRKISEQMKALRGQRVTSDAEVKDMDILPISAPRDLRQGYRVWSHGETNAPINTVISFRVIIKYFLIHSVSTYHLGTP